jgi:integrase/recombinase XerD
LFESNWKKPYSPRGVRAMLARYAERAGGHATHTSLEIYSRLALTDAQQQYDEVIGRFPD